MRRPPPRITEDSLAHPGPSSSCYSEVDASPRPLFSLNSRKVVAMLHIQQSVIFGRVALSKEMVNSRCVKFQVRRMFERRCLVLRGSVKIHQMARSRCSVLVPSQYASVFVFPASQPLPRTIGGFTGWSGLMVALPLCLLRSSGRDCRSDACRASSSD